MTESLGVLALLSLASAMSARRRAAVADLSAAPADFPAKIAEMTETRTAAPATPNEARPRELDEVLAITRVKLARSLLKFDWSVRPDQAPWVNNYLLLQSIGEICENGT